jgi:glycerol-3-phosphate acyltransferase PlsY
MTWILALALGYLLGSVPFGLLLTRLTGAGDLRTIGSGNIGATNVLRTGRKGLAAATLLLDLAKGAAAVLIARAIWPGSEAFAAIGAVVGHCFPIWLGFRGGKGVATLAGVCFGLTWPLGLVYAVLWIGTLAATRISSVGGMTAAVGAPVAAWLLGYPDYAAALAVLALLVVWMHRANITRLRSGTEPRVGGSKA